MRVGVFSTRLAGTDGVSLETAKWATVLSRMGHEVFYCAGELDENGPPGVCIPAMHFRHPPAVALSDRAFASSEPDPDLEDRIASLAEPLAGELLDFVDTFGVELVIVENAHAIPMQLILGKALAELIVRTGLPTVCHHHDFYWERERFNRCRIPAFLDTYFPFDGPNVQHVVIHSLAQRDLRKRRGLASTVVPNVFDFAVAPPGIDDFNRDFRAALGLTDEDLLVLQPTRVVPRKGIELAIELLHRLDRRSQAKLVITHEAGDEGLGYLQDLQNLASRLEVDLRYVPELVSVERRAGSPSEAKVYCLWDAYPHADLVTYPSLYEGFGNALIESVYFRRPTVVNRYSVYQNDIGPRGFDFVEIDGAVTDEAAEAVDELLANDEARAAAVAKNFALGQRYFSYEVLQSTLESILG